MAKTPISISKLFKNFRYNSINGGATRKFSSAISTNNLESQQQQWPLEILGGKDYQEYRRSLYGDISHKALLVDAVGTLVVPSQPMAQIYKEIGEKYGVVYSEDEILNRYRWAYGQPWGNSRLRYVDDGKPFWKFIVKYSTGCEDAQYFEELYDYYTTEKAWRLCDPDAEGVFKALRDSGVKLAVVSNFDTRLRPVLRALNCDNWFDAVAVSAEVEAEKPNPTIFLKACELLGVKPEEAVHVGDDRRNDVWGARDAGCDAWLWGSDVHSFKEVGSLEYMQYSISLGAEGFLKELGERGLEHVLTLEDVNVHETVCVHYDDENNPKSIYIDDYEKFKDFCEKLHEVRFYVNDPIVPHGIPHLNPEP